MATTEVTVSCIAPWCRRPAPKTTVPYEPISPGILAVPRLICAGCGSELWVHRDVDALVNQ